MVEGRKEGRQTSLSRSGRSREIWTISQTAAANDGVHASRRPAVSSTSVSGARAVDLVEVDPLRVEAAQRLLDRAHDPAARVALPVGVLTHRAMELRGQDDVVAAAPESLADDLLRLALGVDVGSVDEGDAGVQRGVDDANHPQPGTGSGAGVIRAGRRTQIVARRLGTYALLRRPRPWLRCRAGELQFELPSVTRRELRSLRLERLAGNRAHGASVLPSAGPATAQSLVAQGSTLRRCRFQESACAARAGEAPQLHGTQRQGWRGSSGRLLPFARRSSGSGGPQATAGRPSAESSVGPVR